MRVSKLVGVCGALALSVLLGTRVLEGQIRSTGALEAASERLGGQEPLKATSPRDGRSCASRTKLSGPLARLADRAEVLESEGRLISAASIGAEDATAARSIRSGFVRFDGEARVQIFAHAAAGVEPLVVALRAAGGSVEQISAGHGLVQARVDPARVRSLSEHPSVARLRLPDYAHRQSGSVASAGDAILAADLVRQQLGVDGTGVSVGVISDGVNGLPIARASGNLPFVDTATCNVVPGSNPQRAAPHAAAIAALLLDLRPDLRAGEPGDSPSSDRRALREALQNGAVDLGPSGPDVNYGDGRIDALASADLLGGGGPSECVKSSRDLCLSADRFRVSVTWRDTLGSGNGGSGNGGEGTAVGLSADTGYFWFFDPANVELVVKVLDARAFNGNFWVFYGALSNVEYTITVTDTDTGRTRTYFNEAGEFGSLGDTNAFPASATAATSSVTPPFPRLDLTDLGGARPKVSPP